ncbi:MAG: Trm112 family protein [Mariniblastus sp.]
MATNFDSDLMQLIRCPQTKSPLTQADDGLISDLNKKISSGDLVNQIGQSVAEPLESGFLNEDQSLILPVRGGIVILIADQAIPMNQ